MRHRIIHLLVALLLLLSPIGFFYWHYEQFAQTLIREHQFDGEKANAAKHAFTAAQVFTAFRAIVDDQSAERLTVLLGHFNEYAEQYAHYYRADTPREVLKDLYNNQAGIATARWYARQEHPHGSLRDTIIALAQQNILIVHAPSLPMSADDASSTRWPAVRAALRQFEIDRAGFTGRVESVLEKTKP